MLRVPRPFPGQSCLFLLHHEPIKSLKEPTCDAQTPAKVNSFQVTGGGEETTLVGGQIKNQG